MPNQETDRSGSGERAGTADRGGPRELWPRDFGRDGVSGLVTPGRATRARDVSRPRADDLAAAEAQVDELIARSEGRRGVPRHRPPPES